MTDNRTPDQRRRIMQAVATKDTGPERLVRRLLFQAGYRYRLHAKDLPGRPDIVFPSRKKAVFVNGCFWHGHSCAKGRRPTSNTDYWEPKLNGNLKRDALRIGELEALGWSVLTVWQCETRETGALTEKLFAFLGRPGLRTVTAGRASD